MVTVKGPTPACVKEGPTTTCIEEGPPTACVEGVTLSFEEGPALFQFGLCEQNCVNVLGNYSGHYLNCHCLIDFGWIRARKPYDVLVTNPVISILSVGVDVEVIERIRLKERVIIVARLKRRR